VKPAARRQAGFPTTPPSARKPAQTIPHKNPAVRGDGQSAECNRRGSPPRRDSLHSPACRRPARLHKRRHLRGHQPPQGQQFRAGSRVLKGNPSYPEPREETARRAGIAADLRLGQTAALQPTPAIGQGEQPHEGDQATAVMPSASLRPSLAALRDGPPTTAAVSAPRPPAPAATGDALPCHRLRPPCAGTRDAPSSAAAGATEQVGGESDGPACLGKIGLEAHPHKSPKFAPSSDAPTPMCSWRH